MSVMVAAEHFRPYWELPLTLVQEFAGSIEKGAVAVACMSTSTGWKLSRQCAKYPIIFHDMLHVASCDLRLQGCSGGRLGHGANNLECMPGDDETLLISWKPGCPLDWHWQQALGTVRLSLPKLFGDDWHDMVFLQFFIVSLEDIALARQAVPDVPQLGRMYEEFDPDEGALPPGA
eukprot:5854820-Pyramimonas_sp.AAC.1